MRLTTVALLALFLLWEIASRSLVAYLAERAPESAVVLRRDAVALLTLAEENLTAALDETTRSVRTGGNALSNVPAFEPDGRGEVIAKDRVRDWAKKAMLDDPINPRALRILGQLAEAEGDDAKALPLMRAAARLSLHESVAVYSLLRRSYEHAEYGPAARYADILLRTRPRLTEYLAPALARIAEQKDGRGEIEKLLAADPPWREDFFSLLPANLSDAHTPLELFLRLKDTPAPPKRSELEAYLKFLIRQRHYETAYYTWLQFLPPEQLGHLGLLFNGNFEKAPSGLPFDWTITPGAGVTVDIIPSPDGAGKRVLLVEFGYGRVEFKPVTQLTMLPHGTYKLIGKFKGSVIARRGLQWRIACAEAPHISIGEATIASSEPKAWLPFDLTFRVAAANCAAQYVSLTLDARSSSEQLVSGSMMFRDLQINRGIDPQSARQ